MFVGALALYLLAALILTFGYDALQGDAVARVANAYYTMFSRDPHLAAIGFVWNPLPSISVMPLLPFKFLWPALAERAFAGNIVSAVCMAGAAHQLWAMFVDWGLERRTRLVLAVAFICNPIIFEHAAIGMSEGLFLLTLMVTARQLSLWLVSGGLRPLALSATALGLGYLTRYEAAAPAMAAAALVLIVSYARAEGERRGRALSALADLSIFVLPFAMAFAAWAVASYIIVGHPFEQFSSIYGNSSQLSVIRSQGGAVGTHPSHVVKAVLGLAPLLPFTAIPVAVLAWRRRDLRILGPVTVLGGTLAFAVLAAASGATAGWLRYYITAVPLAIVLGGALLISSTRERALAPIALAVALATAAITLFGTGRTLVNPRFAPEEQANIAYIWQGSHATKAVKVSGHRYAAARHIARLLDRIPGHVLMDTFGGCSPLIVLNSHRPGHLVITNDRDFERALADPAANKISYLVVPAKQDAGVLDAVNRQYPTLDEDGAGIATLASVVHSSACHEIRLWKVKPDSTPQQR